MHQGIMKAWLESSHLNGANSTYVEEMYEAYQDDRDLAQKLEYHISEYDPK